MNIDYVYEVDNFVTGGETKLSKQLKIFSGGKGLNQSNRDSRVRGLLQFYGANRTGRWSGRLVQVQNLPKNYLETLSYARDCVKEKKVDA